MPSIVTSSRKIQYPLHLPCQTALLPLMLLLICRNSLYFSDGLRLLDTSVAQPITFSKSCQRRCPNRLNKLYYHNGKAGLRDREYSYRVMSNIAGYLCAVLEVAPPHASLDPKHNNNETLAPDVKWEDFFNISFLDGTQALFEARDNPFIRKGLKNWRRPGIYRAMEKNGWLVVLTKSDGDLLEDYQRVQDLSWKQTLNDERPFVWEIHRTYFESELSNTRRLPDISEEAQHFSQDLYTSRMQPSLIWSRKFGSACDYIDSDPHHMTPSQLQFLRHELRARTISIAPSNTSLFGFFHIRRGDSIASCDTSLNAVREYFRCSLSGIEKMNKQITFLLASDEKSPEYRQSVLSLAVEFDNIAMLDADQIASEMMRSMANSGRIQRKLLNNYYQYELLKTLGMDRQFTFSSVFLIRRRKMECSNCTNLHYIFQGVM